MGFRTVRRDEPGFYVSDGVMVGNRAFLEIAAECPENVRRMVQQAHDKGWIRVNATFTEKEYAWLMLQE
jgi:hypothetical protein